VSVAPVAVRWSRTTILAAGSAGPTGGVVSRLAIVTPAYEVAVEGTDGHVRPTEAFMGTAVSDASGVLGNPTVRAGGDQPSPSVVYAV
jgi:hypothetical protein